MLVCFRKIHWGCHTKILTKKYEATYKIMTTLSYKTLTSKLLIVQKAVN